MAINCFRFFHFKNFDEVDRITLAEYELMMKAERLKQTDMDYRNHLQAFLNFAVQAEKKSGKNKTKPVYSRFSKFYDYEEELEKARNHGKRKSRYAGIEKILKKGG